MNINQKPIVVITMGDAAGVGPEIVVKVLLSRQIFDICRPLVAGEGSVMSETIRLLDSPVSLHRIEKASEFKGQFGTIDILDLHNLDQKEVVIGKVCKACGQAAMEYIGIFMGISG